MNPKEKAFELYFKYYRDVLANSEKAKQCAIIAVDEIIKVLVELSNGEFTFINNVEYYQEVKQEIFNH